MVFPRFQWVDKSQCRYENEQGQIQNPTQADCAQAVSAVKAIAIAQAEGQRIYTINQSNAATALAKLPVGGTVGQEIQSAVMAGKEVTVHERQMNAHGFSGYGYIITDPETGSGAYMIEGKGNGGSLYEFIVGAGVGALLIASALLVGQVFAALLAATFGLGLIFLLIFSLILLALILLITYVYLSEAWGTSPCFLSGFATMFGIPIFNLPKLVQWFGWMLGLYAAADPAAKCVTGE